MSSSTLVDLDALAELARKATPGPWVVHAGRYEGSDYCYVTEGKSNLADDIDPHDAAFIAAANPQTVLALIDMARRAAASTSTEAVPVAWQTYYPDGSTGVWDTEEGARSMAETYGGNYRPLYALTLPTPKVTTNAVPAIQPIPDRGEVEVPKPVATGQQVRCEKPSDCCPNVKEVGGGFEGERYRCDVCGYSYFLDYEDMK